MFTIARVNGNDITGVNGLVCSWEAFGKVCRVAGIKAVGVDRTIDRIGDCAAAIIIDANVAVWNGKRSIGRV